MATNANPWSKFFWSDWESDPALRLCSLAAQGLWMRMLCICAKSHPVGYLSLAGRALDHEDVARLAGITPSEANALIQELERNGVFSRDRNQVIYSRRIISDAKKAKTNAKNGKIGGEVSVRKQKGIFQSPERNSERATERQDERHSEPQKPEARSQNPPNPQKTEEPAKREVVVLPEGKLDEIRKVVWRLSGLTEDQIGTKFQATSREGLAQIRAWLDLGFSLDDIQQAVVKAFDEKESSGGRIEKPWSYLDAVMRRIAEDRDKPDLTAADHRDPMRDTWRARLKGYRERGVWFDHFGTKPDAKLERWTPACTCPPDILAEFGFGMAAPTVAQGRGVRQ
jgi:ribosomal protein S25